MISSKYILDILELLLDGGETGKALRPQLDYLTDNHNEYTGPGLFVTFQCSSGIEKHKYRKDKVVLDGVSITSTELGMGASAIVFVSNGVIDTLEIFSYDGEYPRRGLSNYILKQEGDFSAEKS